MTAVDDAFHPDHLKDPDDVLLMELDPPLDSRLCRLLSQAGYLTVGDVVAATDAELTSVHGFGRFSVRLLRTELDHRMSWSPVRQLLLDDLRNELTPRLAQLLKREGFQTAEEVAVITNDDLLGIRMLGRPSLHTIRRATLPALAMNYTNPRPARPTTAQAREFVSVLAELALYAEQDQNYDLARRARLLIQSFAPEFPDRATVQRAPSPSLEMRTPTGADTAHGEASGHDHSPREGKAQP